jgi:hypothetical protein
VTQNQLQKCYKLNPYFLPSSGETVYLELNYKCNQPFNVGVINSAGGEEEML